jgi:hypothetical protein
VRRNERKMGGFASWEIFGTGFKIWIILQVSRDVQVSKFRIFPQFPVIFRGPKKSQNADFSAVSRDFKGQACPNILRGFPTMNKAQHLDLPAVSRDFQRTQKFSKRGFSPRFLGILKDGLIQKKYGTQTSPQFSRDFEGSDPPKKIVNPQTYPRFSWDFKRADPPAKSSHWTANPGNREV